MTKAWKILRLVGASYYYLLAFKQETAKELLAEMPHSALNGKVASPLRFSQPRLASLDEKIFQPTADALRLKVLKRARLPALARLLLNSLVSRAD